VGLEWDAEQLLADVNAGVDLAAMFKADEIAELLAGVKGGAEADAEPQIDQAEELNKKWQVKTGDLWKIGAHRLLCGDSTKAADVARVMGGGGADCVLTDPPYSSGGFQEAGRSSGSIGTTGPNGKGHAIANDTLSSRGYMALMKSVLGHTNAGVAYIFTDWRMWVNLFDICESSGFGVRNMIVWDKGAPGMGRGWRSQHELVLAAMRVTQPFDPKKAQGNVIQSDRTGNKLHPTQKPVDLLEKILDVTDMAEVIYDPFAGSGGTMVACENLGRKCRAIELGPAFCAVILERMAQAFPKLEITRDDGAG